MTENFISIMQSLYKKILNKHKNKVENLVGRGQYGRGYAPPN